MDDGQPRPNQPALLMPAQRGVCSRLDGRSHDHLVTGTRAGCRRTDKTTFPLGLPYLSLPPVAAPGPTPSLWFPGCRIV
jgi:hypothetical protein